MRVRRLVLASAVLFVFAVAWNAVLHLVILQAANASVAHLRRPDLADTMWLSLVVTAGLVVLFTWGWTRFARDGSLGEGVRYGVFFALVAGLLVDLNQYVLFPIPAAVALQWFLGGLGEFVCCGVITAKLVPPALPLERPSAGAGPEPSSEGAK